MSRRRKRLDTLHAKTMLVPANPEAVRNQGNSQCECRRETRHFGVAARNNHDQRRKDRPRKKQNNNKVTQERGKFRGKRAEQGKRVKTRQRVVFARNGSGLWLSMKCRAHGEP